MTTPVFTGTAEANATIRLFDGTTIIGTGLAGPYRCVVGDNVCASLRHPRGHRQGYRPGREPHTPSAGPIGRHRYRRSGGTRRDVGDHAAISGTAEVNSTITLFDGKTLGRLAP